MSFRQADMPATRYKMMGEIFHGMISTTEFQCSVTEIYESKSKKKTKEESRQEKLKKVTEEVKNSDSKGKRESNGKERQEAINWPKSNSPEWGRFDKDVSTLLKIIYSPPEKKTITHPSIIYQMSKERFGLKERKKKQPQNKGPSRRQKLCKQLRDDINKLKEAYRQASVDEQ